MNRYVFLALISCVQLIGFALTDVTHDKNLIEYFKLKQLIPPLNNEIPQENYQVALYFRIYKLDDLNKPLVSKWQTFSLGYHHTPACIDHVAAKMGLLERVSFTCPHKDGLSNLLANDYEIDHAIIKQDLFIDMQLWKYGDSYQIVE